MLHSYRVRSVSRWITPVFVFLLVLGHACELPAVAEMVSDATKHRRFDEVAALAQNVEDLDREIDQINGQLGQLDFAGAFQTDTISPAG